ncbi:MAG: glycosyltransferase family 2 protein [Gemmatimonadota bacterium]
MTFVYICIPVHDEERTIGPLLWKVRRVMAEYGRDYHIVVADDASTDATADILASYRGVLPLTVVRCKERRGYGPTLERALRKAARMSQYPKRDAIVALHGDFTDDPALIPELVRHIEGGADIVANGARPDLRGAPWGLRVARGAFERLARRRGWPRDAGSPGAGFRAYRALVLRKAFETVGAEPLLRSDGWSSDAELLRALAPHARRVTSGEAERVHGRRQRATRFKLAEALRHVRGAAFGGHVPGPFPLESPDADLAREGPDRKRSRSRRKPGAGRPAGGDGRRPDRNRTNSGGEPADRGSGTSKRRKKRRRRGGSGQRNPGADSS